MKRKIVSAAVSIAMLSSTFTFTAAPLTAAAAGIEDWTANTTGTPQYHTTQRQMEELNRGLIASYIGTADGHAWSQTGVYLSWRLLGDESLTNQAFDIYRNGTKIKTTGAHDATNYFDASGTASSKYIVVKAGESIADETAVTPTTNYTAKGSEVTNGNSEVNSFTYVDIPIDRPAPVARMGDGKTSYYYTYDSSHEGGANDASVGDLDGDGDYEIVLKWDPTDSKDSAGADFTGNVYIDAYEIDTNNGGYKWRIDLGKNVTAGQHYTQYIVYDFDGDGRAEVAMQTAPGSIDGTGKFVSEAGDTEEIRNVDNTKSYIGTSGSSKGKNLGPEYYTIFDGETGEAICTTDAIPLVSSANWGDSKYNRAMRFLAGVAYLDGVHPSLIECRGYYARVVIRAYSFDGDSLSMDWEYNSGSSGLYGEGFHNLGIADIDNDGYDEIVYGSACLDQDGKTVLGDTNLGHGDAQHTSDFNNDGIQETFNVHEEKVGYANNAGSFRVSASSTPIWGTKATGDTGRGVMDNIDDEYAKTHSNALAMGWESTNAYAYDLTGAAVGPKPTQSSKTMTNFLVYWDGDLSRELLDGNIIAKYHADGDNSYTRRFYGPSDGYSLVGGASNNYTKATPSLCADIWGDWREEVILPVNKGLDTAQAYLRIYTSTIPTDYRLTTLMHDAQYRCSVAWQNVGYNQPTHQSYYIGSAALAKDSSGNTMNYLAPATLFTNVGDYKIGQIPVENIALSSSTLSVEKCKTGTLMTIVTPSNATKKSVTWTSSDTSVATVSGGTVKGINPGTAVITATSKYDPALTASCTVTVWSTPVTGITLDERMSVGVNCSKKLTAQVLPSDASDQNITWSSSNATVAEVDEEGNVSGKTAGAALITATTDEGAFTASCVVNVTPLIRNDYTGTDKFTGSTDDANTAFSSMTASSATMTQGTTVDGTLTATSTAGGEYHKTFTKLTENKGALSFRFTTGGQKDANGAWDWTGREHTLNIALLGEDEQNILTLSQPYRAGGATDLNCKVGKNDPAAFATIWNAVIDGLGNIQGSTKRWIVNVEFDYDNDSATAEIIGTDSSWEAVSADYTISFDLGGLSFEQLKVYTTIDEEGAVISAKPQLSNLTYYEEIPAEGATETLYEKNTTWYNPWTADDISDWTQTGGSALEYDSANGRIWYNPTKPTSAYNASKTFEVADNAIVTYDVDWYFGNATGRLVNKEYIQFGNKLRLGWSNSNEGGYCVLASTDGGASYNGVSTTTDDAGTETTTVDESKKLFTGSNTQYTKHIQVIFDAANKTIKSLTFDGSTVAAYTNYQLPSDASVNSISFGLERGGGTSDWEYPCGLDSILVSQFVEGADPVAPTMAPTPTPSPIPSPSPTPSPTPVPTEPPLVSNNFEGGPGRIISIDTVDQAPNTSLTGITLYIGTRSTGADATSNFSIADGGVSGSALVLNSGKFVSANRGPRFAVNTPTLEDNTIYTATIQAKPVDGTSGAAELYYGDSTTTQATNKLNLTSEAWGTIKVTLEKANGTVTRTIYLNDTKLTSDSTASFPVFWGTATNELYCSVYFDNLTVTAKPLAAEATATPTVKPTDTPSPSPTATATAQPTETVPPEETTAPTETVPPEETTAPTETAPPEETAAPTPDVNAITVSAPALNEEGKVEIIVTNNGDNDQPVKMIVASYDTDGRLIGVHLSEDISAAANDSITITADAPNADAASYKIMLWDTTGAMNSLMNSFDNLTEAIATADEDNEAKDKVPEIVSDNADTVTTTE
ncbi:MAG: Ig-like domain-containing protein [Candidatus Ornithomonoglobus sp.]